MRHRGSVAHAVESARRCKAEQERSQGSWDEWWPAASAMRHVASRIDPPKAREGYECCRCSAATRVNSQTRARQFVRPRTCDNVPYEDARGPAIRLGDRWNNSEREATATCHATAPTTVPAYSM